MLCRQLQASDHGRRKKTTSHDRRSTQNGRSSGVYNLYILTFRTSARWLWRITIRKMILLTCCVLFYCLFRVTDVALIQVFPQSGQYSGLPLGFRRGTNDNSSLPKLRIVVFDTSPPTADDGNLLNPEPDFLVPVDRNHSRTCCEFSISRLVFVDGVSQLNVFGVNMTLKGPWNWVVYNGSREAYLLGADYFLILNDRSLLGQDWPRRYIEMLSKLDPPNTGIAVRNSPIGPRKVFFHRTHIDIFGYVYPWYIRTSSTYIFLENLYPEDMRLDIDSPKLQPAAYVEGPNKDVSPWIKSNRYYLSMFLAAKRFPPPPVPPGDDQVKVIAMSLYGSSPKYIEGAIRNAQLARIFFTDWSLRFYVLHPNTTDTGHVRYDVIRTLHDLGAQIRYVPDDIRVDIPPMMWRHLVAKDPEVDVFLIQDSDSRLSGRLYRVVDHWLRTTNASVYCMRDHPWHSVSPLSGGMWGAHRAEFSRLMNDQFLAEMAQFNDSYGQDMAFLSQKVWPKVRQDVYCHDSVSCYHWMNAHPWPVPRLGLEHVGEIYNEYHLAYPSNRLKLNQTEQHAYCEPLPRIMDEK
ncbi:hypothetical protein LSH36_214g03024 [Paralvinella palmiformis]|uniref:Uncharacterized protein n=1 Tax=Paralvinella palmiformis TaxID=53620 RepID=A0AAD9JP97_9ANNE|nr:hypothetical protein LSH36_214g03024 [Paralvinella palmiformis]